MNSALFMHSLNLSLSLIGTLLSLLFFLLICIRIRPLKTNIPLILTCNTYVTSFTSSIILVKQSSQTIYGILTPSVSFDGVLCQINGYFIYIALGIVFYSFVLHAIFRLFRIVFYRKKSLYSLQFFSIAIIIQWIFIFLINLPFLLSNELEYIPSEYRCQVSYTNFRGSFMVLIFEYGIPSNIMSTIYFCIIRYIRKVNTRMVNRHDMIVFKHMVVIFMIVQSLSTPLVVLWILYGTINYLTPLTYQIQALSIAFSQAFIPIVLAFSTPQIKEILCKWKQQRRQIHPVVNH